MSGRASQDEPDRTLDPLHAENVFSDTETRIAVAGHPIHAMLVAFPIALTMCTLGADHGRLKLYHRS